MTIRATIEKKDGADVAKVLMPLLSEQARGSIGKSLVYFPWKGINAVRSYVVPANPNSLAQQTQRGFLKAGVLQWRTLGYTLPDRTAYNNLALIQGTAMSGFNVYMKGYVDANVGGKTHTGPYTLLVTSPAAGYLNVSVKVKDNLADLTVTAYYDTKQHGKISSMALAWSVGDQRYYNEVSGIGTGVVLWVYVEATKVDFEGITGDLKVKIT